MYLYDGVRRLKAYQLHDHSGSSSAVKQLTDAKDTLEKWYKEAFFS